MNGNLIFFLPSRNRKYTHKKVASGKKQQDATGCSLLPVDLYVTSQHLLFYGGNRLIASVAPFSALLLRVMDRPPVLAYFVRREFRYFLTLHKLLLSFFCIFRVSQTNFQ